MKAKSCWLSNTKQVHLGFDQNISIFQKTVIQLCFTLRNFLFKSDEANSKLQA